MNKTFFRIYYEEQKFDLHDQWVDDGKLREDFLKFLREYLKELSQRKVLLMGMEPGQSPVLFYKWIPVLEQCWNFRLKFENGMLKLNVYKFPITLDDILEG